ncbi:MAG: phosphotransferase [Ktedonobacteraceae bacterium]|nr:phosphotransferase [Ktedonobacteraceae bacterium]
MDINIMIEEANLARLWQVWPIAGPWRLSPLAGGTNNLVWRAETVGGECYVLRLFPDRARLPRLRYEAALLEALSNANLPFRLPLPIRTRSGESIAVLEQEMLACAILSPFLPGECPDRNDLALVSPTAEALAVLDNALAALPDIVVPGGFEPLFSYGDLVSGYMPVPDSLAAVERLPIARDKARQMQNILASILEAMPNLYTRLPQQLLHLDYCPPNLFVEDRQVTAIFDFEFAGIDLRVMELCVALSWWPVHLMGTGKEWEVIDAFAEAYVDGFPLSIEELRAIPEVLRLRDAGSLIHRMGRYFAGLETDARIQERVEHSLWREAWLNSHREMLLQHAMAWSGPAPAGR